MSKTSLRLRLFSLWALSLVACLAVGLLLAQLYRQSTAAQVGRAEADIAKACGLIRDGYGAYAGKWSEAAAALSDQKLRLDLATVVRLALAGRDGVEGGVWQKEAGSLAYAFPTYEETVQERSARGQARLHPSRERRGRARRAGGRSPVRRGEANPAAARLPALRPNSSPHGVGDDPGRGRPLFRSASLRPQRPARFHAVDVGVARPRADRLGAVHERRRGRPGRRRRGRRRAARASRGARGRPRRPRAQRSGPAPRKGAPGIRGPGGASFARRAFGHRSRRRHRRVGSVGGSCDLRVARQRVGQRYCQAGRRRHLRRKLSRARDRPDSRLEHRPGRHRPGRRRPHGRVGAPCRSRTPTRRSTSTRSRCCSA